MTVYLCRQPKREVSDLSLSFPPLFSPIYPTRPSQSGGRPCWTLCVVSYSPKTGWFPPYRARRHATFRSSTLSKVTLTLPTYAQLSHLSSPKSQHQPIAFCYLFHLTGAPIASTHPRTPARQFHTLGSSLHPGCIDTAVALRYDEPPRQRAYACEPHEHRFGA